MLNISSLAFSAGTVRVEQRNKTLVDMEVYDDGPYEVGDESLADPDLVPVPANSYLGECTTTKCDFLVFDNNRVLLLFFAPWPHFKLFKLLCGLIVC